MCVINPLKVVITNFDEVSDDTSFKVTQPVHPNIEDLGTREIPFSSELFIDRADFSEDTTLSRKKFKRLVLGDYVKLRGALIIKADEAIKDDNGDVIEVRASVVPDTLKSMNVGETKARGPIHWVSAEHAVDCEVRLYDRLFNDEAPDAGDKNFLDFINPDSLTVIKGAKAEPSILDAVVGKNYQFEREGYFCLDSKHSAADALVFNQTIGLKDNWSNKK